MLSILCTIVSLVASWMIYKKMGREGWEGIIPIYSTYVLCQELYGNGWKCLLLLIPPHIFKCFLLKIQGFPAFSISVNEPKSWTFHCI